MNNLASGFLFVYSALAATPSDTGSVKGSVRGLLFRLAIGILFTSSVCSWTAIAQSTLGTISGIVVSDQGLPLANVRITATTSLSIGTSKAQTILATGHIRGYSVSNEAGSFDLENVPPGKYHLCAQGSSTHLDPCNWSTPTEVTVNANEKLSKIKLQLMRGGLVQVRLNDPKHLLTNGGTNGQPYVMLVIAGLGGRLHHFGNESNSASDRTQSLLVPLNENFELLVNSRNVVLTDSAGKTLPSPTYQMPIHIDPTSPLINFTVMGLR